MQMKELLAKLLDDDEDMLDLHLSAKAAEADARTAALQRLSLDASRPGAADGAVSSHALLLRVRRVRGPPVWAAVFAGRTCGVRSLACGEHAWLRPCVMAAQSPGSLPSSFRTVHVLLPRSPLTPERQTR
jgi:hypothetical protein